MHELVLLLDRIPDFPLENATEMSWADWLLNFKTVMAVIFVDLPETKKVSTIVFKLSPSFIPVFRALDIDLEQVKFVELITSLTQYFKSVNTRLTFYARRQREKESFEGFAKDLTALSTACNYSSDRLSLVRDMFILNMHPKYEAVRKRILEETRLPLNETVDFANKILEESRALSDWTMSPSSREARRSQEAAASVTSVGKSSFPVGDGGSSGAVPTEFGKGSQDGQKENRDSGEKHSLGEMRGNGSGHRPDGGVGSSKTNNDFRRSGCGTGGFRHESEVDNSRTHKLGSPSGSGVSLQNRAPIPPGKFATVKVACIDRGIVHVCLEDDLEALDNIDDIIRNSVLRPIHEAKQSFICATKFLDCWCRVKILKVDHEQNKAHVLFFDWGNSEWVPVSELMFLPNKLVHLPGPMSFPIVVPSPEKLQEGDLLKVLLKEKDERGIWTAELEHSSSSDAGKRNQEEFGPEARERHGRHYAVGGRKSRDRDRPTDGRFRPGGPNAGGERRNRGNFGQSAGESRQGRPSADDERNGGKLGYSDGESRKGRPNNDGDRGKFGRSDGESRQGRPNDDDDRRKFERSDGESRQGRPSADDERNGGKFGYSDGESRKGRPNNDGDRGKFGRSDGESHQGRHSADVELRNRCKSGPTEGGYLQGGSGKQKDFGPLDRERQGEHNASGGKVNRDNLGPTEGEPQHIGPSADFRRRNLDQSGQPDRQAGRSGVDRTRNFSGSANSASLHGTNGLGSFASNGAERGAGREFPDLRNLSIESHARGRSDDTPARRPPPPIPSNEFTKVRVVWAGPEGVFGIPHDKVDDWSGMLREVNAWKTTEPGRLDVHNVVVAPFGEEFYRARILSVDQRTSKARLTFIDFGNEDDVPFDALWALPARLHSPVHTFRFRLDSASQNVPSEGDVLTVKPIALEPDGVWLLQASSGD